MRHLGLRCRENSGNITGVSEMKKIFQILFLMTILSTQACSDEKAGIDIGMWCNDTCQKELECEPGPTLEECTLKCGQMAANMLPGYLDAYAECMELSTCAELTANKTLCEDAAKPMCSTDVAEYNRTACLKILECDGNTDPSENEIAQCILRQHGSGDLVKCFKVSLVDSVVDCIVAADSCSPVPVAGCVYDILGLVLGSGNQNQ